MSIMDELLMFAVKWFAAWGTLAAIVAAVSS